MTATGITKTQSPPLGPRNLVGEADRLITRHDNGRGETSGGTREGWTPRERPRSGGPASAALMAKCDVAWRKDVQSSAVRRAPLGAGSPERKPWKSQTASLGKRHVVWREHARGDRRRVRTEDRGQRMPEGTEFHLVKQKYPPNPAIARHQLVRSLCTKKA